MAIRWNRLETWLTLGVFGVGGILLAVAGLWIYVSATSRPLFPSAQDVTSVAQASPGQQWSAAADRAREIVRGEVAAQNLPGVSVAVGVGNDLVWAEGFGWSDIATQAPVTPATRFRLGTLSIPLTSAAVGVMLEKHQVDLDEKIQTYVPDFPAKRWSVTLRHLMSHTAGLSSDSGDEGPLFGMHCDRAAEAFSAFAGRDLRFEPGTEYYYSRFSFIPVSAAIEQVSGDTFARFMRRQVFEPLGMNDTAPDATADAASADRATSYFPRFASDTRYGPDLIRPLDYSCYAGSSEFVSTPSDLVRFAMALNGGGFLKPETVQLLQTSQRLPSGNETGYGLGWDLETMTLAGQPAVVVGHDGDLLGGIASTLMVLRDRGLVVAVLSNTSYADTPGLAVKIAETFIGQRH
jgi:CubicO group peptidase (beta-lactamase class C family)